MALMSATDFLAALDDPANAKVKIPEHSAQCATCNVTLHEHETGYRRLGDGTYVCSDCYFERMGADLESFPIIPPRVRRRA